MNLIIRFKIEKQTNVMNSLKKFKKLTQTFIKSKFSDYYIKNGNTILAPNSIEQREFGFFLFSENMVIRHKAFKKIVELRNFITNIIPSDVYHSAAYYNNPEAPMDKKGWKGSDLIFDIDADHIETECKKKHDTWSCIDCKNSDFGKSPHSCPKCGGFKFKQNTWMCSQCLEKAKEEVLKLIDLIHLDFGIKLENIRVNFSGHRGYHLHIDSQQVRNLDTEDRKEIVDYIIGTGLDTNLLDIWDPSGKIKAIGSLSPNDPGWRGRLAKRIIRIFSDANEETLKSIGLKSQTIESILKLQTYNNYINQDSSWRTIKGIGRNTWNILIQRAIALDSVGIDTVVTTDIHRLIRVAGTLNGKTGLKTMNIEIDELPEFNPFKRAVAFDGYETIHIEEAPKFMLGDQEFGPYNNVIKKLPRAAALLLLCKERAHPVMN